SEKERRKVDFWSLGRRFLHTFSEFAKCSSPGSQLFQYFGFSVSRMSAIFHIYRHYPNKAPRLLLTQYEASGEEERKSRRGFSATLDKQEKTFYLKKNSSELSDSAVYYCAMRDTVTAASRGAAQKSFRWENVRQHRRCVG
uniref:Immunoglobulin V-set domain-containing protein n=1 Tax=Pelusios castaneus TaxID=367368 RepID=A0A8C8SNB7_9SAUR